VGGERASTFLHLMPLFGAVLSAIFLGETLSWYHYVGALLIFSGIFVASRSHPRQSQKERRWCKG
jgi:drug/metabolite transporter (DMT)-like permease